MKITELQVGDWVYFLRKETKVKPTDLLDELIYKHFNPIPITPEILLKNGFKKKNKNSIHVLFVSEDRRIIINEMSNTIGRDWYCHIDNEDFESIGSADIQNVHELQHLLRLCGIEKEIRP